MHEFQSESEPCSCGLHNEFGQSVIFGEQYQAYEKIDAIFAGFGRQDGATEYMFPNVISAQHLRKLDYLHSFPQHATFPQVLDNDLNNLDAFRNGEIINRDDEIQTTTMMPVKAMLTPAACYHFYIHFSDSEFPKTRLLTTRNTCYRHEQQYVPYERQWSFTMREIVCIGKEEQVQEFVQNTKSRLSEFFTQLRLDVKWEIATDPFFNPENNPKYLLQKLQPNKYEMVFDKRLAVGSVNYHRSYFGETFNIRNNTNAVHSACVAFGIDRWFAALRATFGEDVTTWPLDDMEELLCRQS